jgi:glycosyltransferase involved in cell wall biosynthesis
MIIMSSKKTNVLFLLDPLESLHGPLMPAYLIAKELREDFDIVFASPVVDKSVAELLESCGFHALNLHKHFHFSGSLLTFESWLMRTEFESINPHSLVVNFSQCFLANAHIYYAQGPVTRALDDMSAEMKRTYNLVYRLMRWFFIRRDRVFNKELEERSKLVVANSNFCASMYEDWGLRVDKVIYPPLDCELFKPTTSDPSGNYALTYAGKETKYSVLKKIADSGVKVKAFGSKAPYIPSDLLRQPNVEFLGKVSDQELVDLYSNALYTLSAFTHEPFGYIPVESMACGTPVLTYNRQGPSESIINGQTGWLVENDQQLVDVATKLWKENYSSSTRGNCRKRAQDFDVKIVSKEWLKLIESFAGVL